jgi:hypothetical protein
VAGAEFRGDRREAQGQVLDAQVGEIVLQEPAQAGFVSDFANSSIWSSLPAA